MPKLVSYPSGAVYAEALQNTELCLSDEHLRGGRVQVTALGTPRAISGNFASVFSVVGTDGKRYAIKCFTRDVADQQERYGAVSEELSRLDRPWRIGFEYQPSGILVQGGWYPILKMEWIEGRGLLSWLDANLEDARAVAGVAEAFADAVVDLRDAGLAHGDLQHGNLLVDSSGQLRLIDYDGMFVPSLAAHGAVEKGHVNYQSPARTMDDFDEAVDRFGAWLIYVSLLLVVQDPGLWAQFHTDGDEKMLFGREDFEDRVALAALSGSRDLRPAVGSLRACWTASSLDEIPEFDPQALPAPAELVRSTSYRPRPVRRAVPAAAVRGAPIAPAHFAGGLGIARLCLVALAAGLLGLPALAVSPVVGIALLISALLVLVVVGIPGYLSQPEVTAKREADAAVAVRRAERSAAEARAATAASAATGNASKEQQQVLAITALQQAAAKREREELDRATGEIQAERRRTADALRRLDQEEAGRLRDALARLQEAHMVAELKRFPVGAAQLPGIGDVLVHRLSLHGVVTAADIRIVEVFWSIGYGAWVTDVVNRPGRRAKIEGLGPAKGRTLMAWHKKLSARAKATAPKALSPEQAAAARGPAEAERQRLVTLQASLDARLADETAVIKRRYQGEQLRLRQQLADARKAANVGRLLAAHEAADEAAEAARQAEKEAILRSAAYAGIGLRSFLLR